MKGPPLPRPRHETLGAALSEAAGGPFGLTFVARDEGERFLGFGELRMRARRAAAALGAAGVRPGDRVAIVLPTGQGFMDAFFGVLAAAAVPVPLYPPVRLGRLAECHATTARMLAAVQARLVVSDRRTASLLGVALEQAGPELGWCDASTLADGAGDGCEAVARADDLALIQFSSGSTSEPKPVALSHRQLMAQLAALRALLPSPEGERSCGVSWLPLYHDMGLIGCLLTAVYYPAPLVLIPPEQFLARPALWLRAISRHRATVSVAPAFGFAFAAERVRTQELDGVDLSSWHHALCGAEPVSAAALAGFARRFAPNGFDSTALRPVYGLAEAALAVTFAPAGRGVRTLGVDPRRLAGRGEAVRGARTVVSVGTPVPGFAVEVRGDDGRELPERRVGHVFARGPSLMSGYFGRPHEDGARRADGWLDTEDLGFVADGELYLCGRDKDIVVIRGANHAAEQFEESLAGLKGLRAGRGVAVGFVPDGEDAEQLLILAERRLGASASDADLAVRVERAVLEHTGIRPHTVRILAPGTLPRTSSGKLRRREALRRVLAGELSPPASASLLRLAVEVVRSRFRLIRLRLRRHSP